jgi:hypothetical protein
MLLVEEKADVVAELVALLLVIVECLEVLPLALELFVGLCVEVDRPNVFVRLVLRKLGLLTPLHIFGSLL